MRKTIAVFLVVSLLCLSGSLYAEKKGAEIIIHKIDDQQVTGELIAVKENSLLLLSYAGADVSVDIGNIKTITVVKKSKAVLGVGIGVLIGGGVGALVGAGEKDDSWVSFTKEQNILIGATIFGALGALVGGSIGAIAGTDKTIQIEGKSDSEIKDLLVELRKKARVPDFQ